MPHKAGVFSYSNLVAYLYSSNEAKFNCANELRPFELVIIIFTYIFFVKNFLKAMQSVVGFVNLLLKNFCCKKKMHIWQKESICS